LCELRSGISFGELAPDQVTGLGFDRDQPRASSDRAALIADVHDTV
jgi:hypothetical protein